MHIQISGGDCLQQFSLSSCFEEYTGRWSLELDVLDVRRCTVGGWGLGTVQLQEQTESYPTVHTYTKPSHPEPLLMAQRHIN